MKLTDEGQPGPNRPEGGGGGDSREEKQQNQGFTDGDRMRGCRSEGRWI